MNSTLFRMAPLDMACNRNLFSCGSIALDQYFYHQVSQDFKRNVTSCFVALDSNERIAGYYTLSSASVALTDLPEATIKKLPRYPTVPTARLGRLAVDNTYKRMGLGGALLADAFSRVINSGIGIYAIIVDAKNEMAADFYRYFGFIPLSYLPETLFLPVETIKKSMKK